MKGLKIYLIAGGALLLLYIIAELNRPKLINWAPNLNNKEKAPFGTYILFDRLHDIFPDAEIQPYRQPIYNVLAEDSVTNSSYVIIAPQLGISKPDYDQIVKYVKAGNDVFIAAESFGDVFRKYLHLETKELTYIVTRQEPVHFLNRSLDTGYYHMNKGIGDVSFSQLDTAKTTILGENNDHEANFIKVDLGKGNLYLLTNPLFFSNYSLLQKDGRKYAETALSYVKNTKQLIWDEYYTQGDEQEDSPMRILLNNPALRWAYYIALFSLLVFVLYEIKRRQRIIPVIKPLENSTVDFVNVVGQVYYEKRDNVNIARKKILYFLSYLRDELNLKTNKFDREFIDTLTQKTGADREFITELINCVTALNDARYVSNNDLIELNNLIEQFYTQSR